MVDNFRLTVDSNTEIEPLDSVRDVKMRGVSVTNDRVANIPQMTGATANANGSAGVVPEPSVSDRDKYLKGDGTWAEVQTSGSNVQWNQKTQSGANIAEITIDNVTTQIYAPQSDPNAVTDVTVNGTSVVNNHVAAITESVVDVVDGNGDSIVDQNGVAHVLGEVVDVVDGSGNTLVDNNGVAHVTGDVTDVLYDNKSVVNNDGVAELFTPRKVTTLPLLDYENEQDISGSAFWVDTSVHRWTAPCDCVVYVYDHVGTSNTAVRYSIGDFVYYATTIGSNRSSAPYGILSNLLPVKKGQEITIQLQGQAITQLYTKAYYIPYKTVDESAESFPLPYLDHANRVGISSTSYTAPTDGVVVDYTNSKNTITVTTLSRNETFYGKGGTQYFDCSVPVSAGDVVTLGSGSLKYFIPFKRTNDINKLVSPIPDYANRVTYTSGESLPTSFDKEGFLFLCAHENYSGYSSSMSVDYTIENQQTPTGISVVASNYNVSGYYWKDSFCPVDPTMVKGYYGSTPSNAYYYFIPYSEFDTVYVKDVLINGASVVGDGSVASIESLVTDVQLNGESLVGEGGIAHITGKVSDVQVEGISILDNNAVANIKSPILTATSPVLDYANAQYITESATWKDTNEHTWTAPCDCVIWYYLGYGSNDRIRYTVGSFVYETYRNAYHSSYNSLTWSNYDTMFPVAKGTTVTIQFVGTMDTTSNNPRLQYIPYKKLTSLQSDFPQPYLNYSNKITVEWTDPVTNGDRICRYVAPTDGILTPNLGLNVVTPPLVRYYVNDESKTGRHTTKYSDYFTHGIILGKGDIVEIYDTSYATSYEYTGTIQFVPFSRINLIGSMVSPIPDYANAELLDTSDMPSTFDAGYLFNCKSGTTGASCIITLTNSESDTIRLKNNISTYGGKNNYLPLNGTETLSSFEDGGTSGGVYFVPYSTTVTTPVLVSDVKVDGTSVVNSNGIANIPSSVGNVNVTQIQTYGTKIAEIDVDGTTTDLYAPTGGGGGSTVSINRKVSSGENFADITIDGTTTQLYATNTTYSNFTGATSQDAGTAGLVPAPTTSDVDKYLKGDGTWATVSGGSDMTGASASTAGAHGLVPAPSAGDNEKFLRGDGTWQTVSGGGGAGADELTLIEYNALTTAQKNDGTIRFIPKSTNYPIDSSNVTVLNQGTNMTITATTNSVNSSWNNVSSNMGCTYYFAIDVTNYKSVIYTLSTGTAFSTTASNAMYVGIANAIPDTYNYNPGSYEVYNSETTTNLTNESRSLDVSNLTGVHYFIARVTGWNSTINDIQGIPNDNPTQIKYMSKTYAIGELTGATASTDGVGGGVPTPIAGDNTKYLRGDGAWSVVSDSMTLFEYNNLTVDEQNDGAVRFISDGSDISIDVTGVNYFVKANMSVSPLHSNPTKVITTWNGTSSNRNCVYFMPINLSGAETIKYKVNTGTSYGTTNDNRLFVGVATNAPTAASWSSSNYTISNAEDTNNMSVTSRTLDVSELSGLYYLVVKADGWNSTVSDVQVTPESVLPQIKYMSETYALVEDMTGATASADGTNGLVPMPSAGDNTKYLRGDGTWKTPTNTTYSDFTGATSGTGGSHGLVPAPSSGDETKYLKGDGTWSTVSGGGGKSYTETTLYTNSGTSLETITLSDDFTNYDELYFNIYRHADNTDWHIGKSFLTSSLSVGDDLQILVYHLEYESWSITDTKTFTYSYGSGTIYVKNVIGIKYGSGGSGGESPSGINYSTDEQEVGTWIDGSTVYQKTYTYSVGSPTTDWVSLDNTIDKTNNVLVKVDGCWVIGSVATSGNHGYYPLFTNGNFQNSGDVNCPRFRLGDDGFYINASQTTYGIQVWVTIQYTK